jgi:Putative adhesin
VIEDFRGDLEISGSDSGVVKVTGRKSVRALDQQGAEKADKDSAFEIVGGPDQMSLRLREGPGMSGRISLSLEVTVPKGASIEAKRRDGDLHIANLEGAVAVTGRVADLDVRGIGGAVTIEGTSTGGITLRNLAKGARVRSQRAEFSAAAVPGEIHIDAGDFNADGITGPARLSSRSHDVRIHNFRNALEVDLERGDLDLRPDQVPLAHIQAKVRSGDVTLGLPETAGFALKATTRSGDITNGLGAGFKVESRGRSQSLQGAAGTGPEITIDLERGNISVTRGSAKAPPKETAQPLETINQ